VTPSVASPGDTHPSDATGVRASLCAHIARGKSMFNVCDQNSRARGGRRVVSGAANQQGLGRVPRGGPWSSDGHHARRDSRTLRQRTG